MTTRRDLEQATVLAALPRIVAAIARQVTTTCPTDGCLLYLGEHCPACMTRLGIRPRTTTAQQAPAAPPPPGWVRKGNILVRKRAA